MRLFRRTNRLAGAGSIETNGITVSLVPSEPDTVITVVGQVSIDSSPCLRSVLMQALRKRQNTVITVDLSRVTRLDTAGIATLLEVLPLARRKAVKLRLVGICGQPRRLADITELSATYWGAGSEVVFG
jgi:anti-anti-sigma factor